MEMDINFHGQGTLVSALWKLSNRYKLKQQAFKENYNATLKNIMI